MNLSFRERVDLCEYFLGGLLFKQLHVSISNAVATQARQAEGVWFSLPVI